jgi:hypothetical protein
MRSARNFHPEWGYLAPAPSLVRTVRTVLVATAVGAAAGASVVFSLVGPPGTETSEIPVAARTLAQPVRVVSAPLSTPEAALAAMPAGIAAFTEVPAPTDAVSPRAAYVTMPAASAAPGTDPVPVQRKAVKKHHFASRYASRGGPLELLPDRHWGFY